MATLMPSPRHIGPCGGPSDCFVAQAVSPHGSPHCQLPSTSLPSSFRNRSTTTSRLSRKQMLPGVSANERLDRQESAASEPVAVYQNPTWRSPASHGRRAPPELLGHGLREAVGSWPLLPSATDLNGDLAV